MFNYVDRREIVMQEKKRKHTIPTRKLTAVAIFVALIAVGAFIKIPIPPVPITLQFAFTLLAGLILGPRPGSLAVLIYLLMGLLGIPVFTEGGGLSYVLKPTFGYCIGFFFGTFVAGWVFRGRKKPKKLSFKRALLGCVLSQLIVYTIGVIYMFLILRFYLASPQTFSHLLVYGCLIFLPTDLMWCIISSLAAVRLVPLLPINDAQISN